MKNKRHLLLFFLALLCMVAFTAGGLTACHKTQPLPQPENLRVTGTDFMWDKVENATGYFVQINENEPVNAGSATVYSIADFPIGSYTLKVMATGDGASYTDSAWSSVNHTVVSYAITYNLAGGTNHPDNPDSYTSQSSLITLKNPTRSGYIFVQWQEGNIIPAGSNGNKPFTAIWEIDNEFPYNITYVLGDGTNHPDNPNTYTYGSSLITLKNPTRSGYIFLQWQEGNTIPAGSSGNKTFTAVWEIDNEFPYNITYVLGGGTNHPDNPNTYTYGSSLITLKDPTLEGHIFIRWEEGSTIPAGSIGNKTFTAVWAKITSGLEYTPVEGGYSVSKGTADTSGIVVISPEYNGSPIIEISNNGFRACTQMTGILIPSSVIIIKNYAFSGCSRLTSITIPDSVTSIWGFAFDGCRALTSITIPGSVTSILDGAFSDCDNLTSITVSSENPKYKSDNNCIIWDNILIAGCKNSVIPDYVISISSHAFDGCSGLTSITIPDSVIVIREFAFSNCYGLTRITIPDSVIAIMDFAFDCCYNLTSITIPNRVIAIGDSAFSRCSGLTFYIEAANKPSDWNNNWNPLNRPVVWGCTLSSDKTYVESFVKTSTSIINPTASNGIKAPFRQDYTFKEWNTKSDGSGTAYAANKINTIPDDTILYAIWIKD